MRVHPITHQLYFDPNNLPPRQLPCTYRYCENPLEECDHSTVISDDEGTINTITEASSSRAADVANMEDFNGEAEMVGYAREFDYEMNDVLNQGTEDEGMELDEDYEESTIYDDDEDDEMRQKEIGVEDSL